MKLAASAGAITAFTSNFKVQGNYGYYISQTNNTLQVFDLTQSTVSTILSTASAATAASPTGLYINGKYAYIANSSSLQIFDITQITPSLIITTPFGIGSYTANEIYVQGNYAYVCHSFSGLGGGKITIHDISNASYPKLIGNISVAFTPNRIIVQGGNLYWQTSTTGTVAVYRLDVSDPINKLPLSPTLVWSAGGSMYAFTVRGHYLYVNYASIFAIYNLAQGATLVGSVTFPTIPTGWVGEVILQGDYAYLTRYGLLHKINIASPAAPVIVQTISTGSGTSTLNLLQIQGRYAYIVNPTSFTEIRTFDLGGAYVQQLQAGGIKTDRLHVINNTVLGNDLDVFGGAAFGQGFKSYKDSSVQGSLTVTTLSSTSALNMFTVTSGANASTLFIIASTGNVGIGASTPGSKLTVVGDISAAGIIYAPESNSSQWNSNYTTTNSNSANWNTAYRSVSSQPYTIVNATSSIVTARGLNTASGLYSVAAGGKCNTASGCYSYIAAGCCNTNCSPFGFIAGGCCNITSGLSSIFVLGSNITALSANTTYINNMCTSNSIYGTGNQTVLSDGIGANVNGNGPQTLSINYTNGLFVGSCAYVSGNLSVCGSLADYNGNPLVPYTSTSSSVNCGCNSITTAAACGNSILAYSSCCLGNSNILGGCCNTICSCGCTSNNGTAGRSYIQNSNIYSGCKNSIFNGTNSYCYAGYYNNYFNQSTSCMLNNSIMGGNCNCIKDYYLYTTDSTTSSLYNTIINGVSGCIVDFSSCFNTIVNGTCNRLCNGSSYSAILGGCCNFINGYYVNNSVIVGGVCNYTSHCCVFILGSNITSSCNNFTYVNNLSSNGLVFGKLGTANVVAGNASTQAGCKVQIFNGAGASLGYIQVYSA
jgi:hypothetical protein